MIPIERTAIPHLEIVPIRFTRSDQAHAASVVARIDRQSMPVRDRRLIETIDEVNLNPLAAAKNERRIDVVASFVQRTIGEGTVDDAPRQSGCTCRDQRERSAARCQAAQIAPIARHEESLRRAGGADVDQLRGAGRTHQRGKTQRARTSEKGTPR